MMKLYKMKAYYLKVNYITNLYKIQKGSKFDKSFIHYTDIIVVVEFAVSTFREGLEEYLHCSWPNGIVGNVELVCLCQEYIEKWELGLILYKR